jgi:hypothetical protein
LSIAIVILTVTFFDGCISADAALIAQPFIDDAVAVIVQRIA